MKSLLLIALVAACAHSSPLKVVPVVDLAPSPVFVPDRGRIVVTDTSIEILDTITFDSHSAVLTPASLPMLDAIAGTLDGNPSILLVEIRGHSDWEERDPQHRAELSVQRAEAVATALVARGVNSARLTTYGASDDEPLSQTDPAVNRRIGVLILERAND